MYYVPHRDCILLTGRTVREILSEILSGSQIRLDVSIIILQGNAL